ncbi:MAG: alpha/beta fold hydrolase [Thermoleophilaceae bacterium]|nr:alpha/beta fold hydrolase [Thermoleophilaceae bacterium]
MSSAQTSEIVLVPGFAQRGEAWQAIIERLPERYRSVPVEFAAADMDGRVAELAEAARRADAVVGYSLGGRIALHARLRGAIRPHALVLLGVSAGHEDPRARAERRAADEELAAWIEEHTIEEFVERWERSPVFATQSPELVAAQRPGRLSQRPADLATTLRTAGQGALEPVWDRLAEIHEPLLAVAGERDERYARAAARIAAAAPHGRAALVPGAGHAAHLEQPDRFATILSAFLDGVLGRRAGARR